MAIPYLWGILDLSQRRLRIGRLLRNKTAELTCIWSVTHDRLLSLPQQSGKTNINTTWRSNARRCPIQSFWISPAEFDATRVFAISCATNWAWLLWHEACPAQVALPCLLQNIYGQTNTLTCHLETPDMFGKGKKNFVSAFGTNTCTTRPQGRADFDRAIVTVITHIDLTRYKGNLDDHARTHLSVAAFEDTNFNFPAAKKWHDLRLKKF